ncbi:MAG: energy transducer TonB [Candidatus Acidiferrales bacterium]
MKVLAVLLLSAGIAASQQMPQAPKIAPGQQIDSPVSQHTRYSGRHAVHTLPGVSGHRIETASKTGNIVKVRSTNWCHSGIARRLLADCAEAWSAPDLVYSDKAVEEYVPERDIRELLKWRPAENWRYAAPFQTTLYIHMRGTPGFVEEPLLISTAGRMVVIGAGPSINADGYIVQRHSTQRNPIRVDLVAATSENRPIALVVSHIIHELVDGEAEIRQSRLDRFSAPPPEAPSPLRTSAHETRRPVVLRRVEPDYSAAALRANFNGVIQVSFTIGRDGRVTDIHFPSDAALYGLRENIIRALQQWRFDPALKDGVPVAYHCDVAFTFKHL